MSLDLSKYREQPLTDEEIKQSELTDKIIKLFAQGNSASEIVDQVKRQDDIEINIQKVYSILKDHNREIEKFVEENPDFFEQKVSRIVRRLHDYDIVLFSLWDEYNRVTKFGTHESKEAVGILESIRKVLGDKSKIEQLVTNNVEIVHRVKLAEEAQSNFAQIVKEVVGDCPNGHCGRELQRRLNIATSGVMATSTKKMIPGGSS